MVLTRDRLGDHGDSRQAGPRDRAGRPSIQRMVSPSLAGGLFSHSISTGSPIWRWSLSVAIGSCRQPARRRTEPIGCENDRVAGGIISYIPPQANERSIPSRATGLLGMPPNVSKIRRMESSSSDALRESFARPETAHGIFSFKRTNSQMRRSLAAGTARPRPYVEKKTRGCEVPVADCP